MTNECVTLPREVVEQTLEALIYCEASDSSSEEQRFQAAIALRAALEQPKIHVPNAGNMVPAGWKLVPSDATHQWAENLADRGMRISSIASAISDMLAAAPTPPTVKAPVVSNTTDPDLYRSMFAAAPQPPTTEQSSAVVEECLTDELKPRFSAHDDAERLKSVARGMSYNDHGEAVSKHTLMEIAVRLESGGYAAPQPPALEQQVEKESTCKESLQVEQAAVAWLATYTGKVGEPLVYVTSSYELAVENDRNQSPKPLHLHQQNLNCKSNQKRLATLWGYVKAEQSSAVQQPQVEQEPVAVVDFTTEGWREIVDALRTLPDGAQLYTHPQPKREPLTDEEIDKLCPQFDDPMRREMWIIGFKAAHNIK